MKMSVLLRQHFWKTKMCPLFLENRCKEGDNCDYAHSVEDLRTIPDLRRTKLCHKLLKGDKCFNKKCNYAHTQEELKSAQNLFAYKSSMCKFIGTNNCLNGSTCRFAHFVEELRVPRAPEILLEQNNSQINIHNCAEINNTTDHNNNNNNNNHANTNMTVTVTASNNNNINNHNINKEGDMNQMESHHNINMQPSEMEIIRNCDSRNLRNHKISNQGSFMEKNNGNVRGRKERRDTKYRHKPKEKNNKPRMNQYYQMDPTYLPRESSEVYAEYPLCTKQRMNSNTTNYDNVNYNMDIMKYPQDQTEITYEDVQMPQSYEQKDSIKRNDSMKIQKESNKINEIHGEKCEEDSLDKTYRSVDNKDITDLEEEQKIEYGQVDNYNNMYYNINLMNQRSQLNHMNPINQSINENIPSYPLYQQYPMPMQYAYPYMIPYYNNNSDINNPGINKGYTHDNPLAYAAATQMPNPMYYYCYYPYCNGLQANQFQMNSHSQTIPPSVPVVLPVQINRKTSDTNNKRETIEEEKEKKMNNAQSIEYETKDLKENMTEKSCENSSLEVVEENVTCAFEVYRDQIVYSKLDEKLIEEIDKKSKQKDKNTNTQLQKILHQSVQLKLNTNESENDTKEEKIKSNMIACSVNKDDKECKENKLTNSTHHTNDQCNNNNNTKGNVDAMLKKKKGATSCSVYSYISNADANNGKCYKNETPLAMPIPLASASMIPNNMNYPMNYNMNVPLNNYNMYKPSYATTSPYYFGSPYIYNPDQVYKY